MGDKMEDCLRAFDAHPDYVGLVPKGLDDGQLYCNATWDTVLCWPPTPANTSVTKPCPPLKGLDPTRTVTKACHESGRWLNMVTGVPMADPGIVDYITSCSNSPELLALLKNLDSKTIAIAQEVAKNARKLEFVGLGLSLISLIVSIAIFSYFRRLRVFRNMLHLHLMIAILMVVIIRLVLYIDLIVTDKLAPASGAKTIPTINTTPVMCESMFFLLEYFKTVAFGWMFLEGFYLHNQLVFTVFNSEPRLSPYLLAGYGIPLLHTSLWLVVMYVKKKTFEKCLGSYYLEPEFWILDGPRMLELVVNFFFICNVIRVLWMKVRDSHNSSEMQRMKKSVKAALMLIPLLGIPNIMQTIPFNPTKDNIMIFAIWTYCASFTYMYQGLMITIIYCFTNKEVNTVLKGFYSRYRLTHTSQTELRRGSRSIATHYQAKNGQVTTSLDNNNFPPSPVRQVSGRSKTGSGDSTARLMLSVPSQADVAGAGGGGGNRNGSLCNGDGHVTDYGTSERTPLRGGPLNGDSNFRRESSPRTTRPTEVTFSSILI